MIRRYSPVLVAVLLLVSTGWFLHARERNEFVPPHNPLSNLPARLGNWSGTDLPIDNATAQVLGPGDFLLRQYESQQAEDPPVYLFVAYFPSQRTGDTMHSPKNCLPGSGWEPVQNNRMLLRLEGRQPFPVNRYEIQKGLEHQMVLYWYEAQGKAVASEYRAKIDLVLGAIRTNRSDGALIRLTTPVQGESNEAAMQRLQSFAQTAIPALDGFIPQ